MMRQFYLSNLFLFSTLLMAQVDSKILLKKIADRTQKDTLTCFWLNQLIENENDTNIWKTYNYELLSICKVQLNKKNNKYRNTYLKYLSLAYANNAALYTFKNNYEKAILESKKAVEISKSINDFQGISLAYDNIGISFDFIGKIDSSAHYFQKSVEYAYKSKDQSSIAYALTDLAYAQNGLGKNALAISNNLKALKIFETLNDAIGIERTNFALGRMFEQKQDFQSAIEHYEKCKEINNSNNNKQQLEIVLISLANCNIYLKKYSLAKAYLDKAILLNKETKNQHSLGLYYNLYGDLNFETNNLEESLKYYLKANTIFKKVKSINFSSKTNINLAKIYLSKNDYNLAKKYAIEAFSISKKTNFNAEIKAAAQILSNIYQKENNFKEAYYYEKLASKIANEIYFDEKNTIVLKETSKYESQKKQNKINQLVQEKKIVELKSQRQKSILVIAILIFSLLVMVAYMIFKKYKRIKEKELFQSQLEKIEADKKITESELKALKSQMNPHFIFNALNSIQNQFMYGDKNLANKQMENFTALTRDILELSVSTKITIEREIEILTRYLELEKFRFKNNFCYGISYNDTLDIEYYTIPPMLLQPFVENSIKHGLLHKEGEKKLQIHFSLTKNEEMIIVSIKDNGIGRKKSAQIKDKTKHNSFSTASIAQRLQLLYNKNSEDLLTYNDLVDNDGNVLGTEVMLKIYL